MPYRVSCGPNDGRTIIVSHSAAETLRLFRRLQEDGAENIEISHLDLGALTIEQVEATAAEEVERDGHAGAKPAEGSGRKGA